MGLSFKIGDDVEVRSLQMEDAPRVHDLISANRSHLDQWLRWSSSVQSMEDVKNLITNFKTKESEGDGFHCGIWEYGKLAGGVVCWYINSNNKNCEVGYWLGKEFTRRGLATKAASAIIDYLFNVKKIHRVEMQCGVKNKASCAVAERCGLRREGIRRESHWITNSYVDHVICGVLENEWP